MSAPADPVRPFAPACERNQAPILDVLRRHLGGGERVLEIASGTGQHALHFTQQLPELRWQCSDLPDRLAGIRQWLADGDGRRLPAPLPLDALEGQWPPGRFDAVFTANSFHIMPWAGVQGVFRRIAEVLEPDGSLIVYGPFRVGGDFVAESDARFDDSLRQRDPDMGLRDLERVDELARASGLGLVEHCPMPANNHCLVWRFATTR